MVRPLVSVSLSLCCLLFPFPYVLLLRTIKPPVGRLLPQTLFFGCLFLRQLMPEVVQGSTLEDGILERECSLASQLPMSVPFITGSRWSMLASGVPYSALVSTSLVVNWGGTLGSKCTDQSNISNIRGLRITWLLLSVIDALKKENERLCMVNFQLQVKCESQRDSLTAYK